MRDTSVSVRKTLNLPIKRVPTAYNSRSSPNTHYIQLTDCQFRSTVPSDALNCAVHSQRQLVKRL